MRYPRLFLATLGLAMSVSAADGAVFAAPSSQNADDLARENERLKIEVQDLRSRLDAAMKRIAVLEDAAANRSPASSPEGSPPAPIVVEKSPSGMLRKMRADYAAAEEAGTIPPAGDSSEDPSATIRHRRALEKWILDRNRSFRTRVSWPVDIEEIRRLDRETSLAILRPIAPETGKPAGDPFEVRFPAKMTDRLQREVADSKEGGPPMVLDALFIPNLRLRTEERGREPFEARSSIGPMVESEWSLVFRKLGRSSARPRPS